MPGTNLLSQAIARNSSVAISLLTPTGMHHYRSRFLQECPEGFWIESIDDERQAIGEIIAKEQSCVLSFLSGQRKLIFSCPIYRHEPQFAVNEQLSCEALLLPFPKEPKEVQRRDWYRARVSDDILREMQVRIWRIPEHVDLQDEPGRTQQIDGRLRDLSATGIGLSTEISPGGATPCIVGQRVRIEVSDEHGALLVEGRARFVTDKAARFPKRLGVTFTGLDGSLSGRKVSNQIARLVAAVQRDELRRQRREMATRRAS
jgi:c-di-GMP-binding flagellar brake protein YcgR